MKETERKDYIGRAKEKKNWENESEKIIWSDESYFRLFNGDGRRLVWRQSIEKFNVDCLIPTHKSGQDGIMVWGCFHKNGLGPLVRLDGRVNSRDYINLLQDNLLPYLVLLKIRKFLFFKRIMHTSRLSKDW